MANLQPNTNADRQMTISRLLNAPVERVWEIWTNPEHISSMVGPGRGLQQQLQKWK